MPARHAALCLFLLLLPAPLAAQPEPAAEPWTLTRDVALVSRWPRGDAMAEDKVTADLYRPRRDGRVPAAVIVNSSGGVSGTVELGYARLLAANGMATLAIDSFRPRGVRRTADDQTRVHQNQSNADAFAGLRWLAAQPWVDPGRIVVLGVSRGGEAALMAALEAPRRHLRASDIRFAAHIAIVPGGCNYQLRDARSTGAPVFFMLAELDDGTPAAPCLDYARRIRAAGNPNVRIAVYPGVYHGYENGAGIRYAEADTTSRNCEGRFWRDERHVIYDRRTGERATAGDQWQYLLRTCVERGYTVGGDERVKAQAWADLLQFLRDAELLRDEEARAVVPDCTALPEGIVRRNCVRARNGWTGDLVALARAFRGPRAVRADDALAARLLALAAGRGHPEAEWELAILLRNGTGVGRDPARALALARSAAEKGSVSGMNVYGVMIRDGIGRPGDEREASPWFRRAADLRDSYGMVNLGRLLWDGRGGLEQDRAAAAELWRQAIYQDANPAGQALLGEALAAGEGVARAQAEGLALLRAAAGQDRDPAARQRAREALQRLERRPEAGR